MLQPTKDLGLNSVVSELNLWIEQFSDNHPNISVISHSNIVDSGTLGPELGRNNQDGRLPMSDNYCLVISMHKEEQNPHNNK